MCLHGALCSIPFNVICNMTSFRKINVLTFDPTLGVEDVCKDRISGCIVLCVLSPSKLIGNMTMSEKIF